MSLMFIIEEDDSLSMEVFETKSKEMGISLKIGVFWQFDEILS